MNNIAATPLDELYNPGKSFIRKSFGKAQNWNHAESVKLFLMSRAIVMTVSTTLERGDPANFFPPGSIQIKIIGEDTTTSALKWAIPLFNLHCISFPEVGEEVFVIRESDSRGSQPYWISRVNDNNYINKVLARELYSDQLPMERYQFDFKVEDIAEEVTQTRELILSIPFYPGDVIFQGRSDSYIRHSLNPRNQEGILESGIKFRTLYPEKPKNTIGKTKTKSVHISNSLIEELTELQIANVVNNDQNEERNIIYNEAEVIVNISQLSDSEQTLQKVVLGDKQNNWLNRLVLATEKLNLVAAKTAELGQVSSQIIPAFKSVQTIKLSIGKENLSFDVIVDIPQRETVVKESHTSEYVTLSQSIQSIANDLSLLKTTISDHLSKHQYIN